MLHLSLLAAFIMVSSLTPSFGNAQYADSAVVQAQVRDIMGAGLGQNRAILEGFQRGYMVGVRFKNSSAQFRTHGEMSFAKHVNEPSFTRTLLKGIYRASGPYAVGSDLANATDFTKQALQGLIDGRAEMDGPVLEAMRRGFAVALGSN